MPKRSDFSTILIIGSGPIVIGQACEFDYSGTQACRALKQEGYKVILLNSNPATIMTDPELADATYIEPILPEVVIEIIKKEKVDAILPTMGGQTALNLASNLGSSGVLDELGVILIGANIQTIDYAEDRGKFQQIIQDLGYETPRNITVCSLEEADRALDKLGLPVVIRASYTLGGGGSSYITDKQNFRSAVKEALQRSPINKILIEESIYGWKEFELEVMRDNNDNCVIVCSIENLSPMGVHTGDSITVAPALTLTDKEFQYLRDASISIMRRIGANTGGANVQFAIHPHTGRIVVIEMNPRVSRSSALASKATGFPIAKIAAKLAVGYNLDEIRNEITQTTYAAFEPTLDYVVTKIPRFDFKKFAGAAGNLTTYMQSVGEVMAIGRNFCESLQKAIISLDIGLFGFPKINLKTDEILQKLYSHTPDTIFLIGELLRRNVAIEEINSITKIDNWFIREIKKIIDAEKHLLDKSFLESREEFFGIKNLGFSDHYIAEVIGVPEREIRENRNKLKIQPSYRRIDTCAAEFESYTPYLYSSYERNNSSLEDNCEADPGKGSKVIIIGSGPNRIGQGIEFDYSCVKAAQALKSLGLEAIMVNCNPETVSTDYEISDKLYFEPLTLEHVLEIIKKENSNGNLLGCILQMGGQTPLKLVVELHNSGISILGTPSESIDLAEDRNLFRKFAQQLGIRQPKNIAVSNQKEMEAAVDKIPYPVILRPSYVIGGTSMEVIRDYDQLKSSKVYNELPENGPILVEEFLEDAIEIEVDAIANGEQVHIGAIMEQFEKLGIHSGDSSCSVNLFSVEQPIKSEIIEITKTICRDLKIKGFINIQFALDRQNKLYVIEVNPRASRTMPFVAKATGTDFIERGVKAILDMNFSTIHSQLPAGEETYSFVKRPVFSFHKVKEHTSKVGPEMRSTGEVMGIGSTLDIALAKTELADPFQDLTQVGNEVLIIVDARAPLLHLRVAKTFLDNGFSVYVNAFEHLFRENDLKVSTITDDLLSFIRKNYNQGRLNIICNLGDAIETLGASYATLYQKLLYELHLIECRMIVKVDAILKAINLLKEERFPIVALQDLQKMDTRETPMHLKK